MVGRVSISQAASFRAVGFTAELFHSTELVVVWSYGFRCSLVLAPPPAKRGIAVACLVCCRQCQVFSTGVGDALVSLQTCRL